MRSVCAATIGVCSAMLCTLTGAAHGATLAASYGFQSTLAADQAGVADLGVVDPTNTSHFETANVFGIDRTTWRWSGTTTPAEQGGLTFGSSGLLNSNSYSVELVFSFDVDNGWRRIVDVLNRGNDTGFYIDPENKVDVYPVGAGTTDYIAQAFHHVVLTVAPGATPTRGGLSPSHVSAYLDGAPEFSLDTDVMNISGDNLVSLFLDNNQGVAQQEWSAGNIALARFYDGALTDSEVLDLYQGVSPAPGTTALAGAVGFVGLRRKRR